MTATILETSRTLAQAMGAECVSIATPEGHAQATLIARRAADERGGGFIIRASDGTTWVWPYMAGIARKATVKR